MAEAEKQRAESIDDVMLRLCRENDLKALQIECRGPDADSEFAFDATAIWEGFSTSGYSNCTGWGRTASASVAQVLRLARMHRTPAVAEVSGPFVPAFEIADQVSA